MRIIYKLTAMSFFSFNVTYAISFDLDLTGGTANYDNTLNTLQITANDVASGVDAPFIDVVIESITAYFPDTPAKGEDVGSGGNNGTIGDDLKVHIDVGTTTRFKFSLYEAGTTNLYTPDVDYTYSFVIYDIDGNTSTNGGADVVTFFTPMDYTLTDDTSVLVGGDSSSVSFTGTGGNVVGQDGLADFSDPVHGESQENASLEIAFTDVSEFEFSYGVTNNGNNGSGRNMLWDFVNLEVAGTPVNFIPEYKQYPFIYGLLSLTYIFSQRRRKSHHKS